MKKVITAQDINAARKAGQTSIDVSGGVLVTPQAADDAREYGIALLRGEASGRRNEHTRPMNQALPKPDTGVPPFAVPARLHFSSDAPQVADARQSDSVAEEVRRQVMARLGNVAPPALDAVISSVLAGREEAADARSGKVGGIYHAAASALAGLGNVAPAPSTVRMVEAVPPGATTPGLSYMAWENSSFTWTFNYAEALVLLEGELMLTSGGSSVTLTAGDAVAIPANESVTLSAKGRVRCVHSSWFNPETAKG